MVRQAACQPDGELIARDMAGDRVWRLTARIGWRSD